MPRKRIAEIGRGTVMNCYEQKRSGSESYSGVEQRKGTEWWRMAKE